MHDEKPSYDFGYYFPENTKARKKIDPCCSAHLPAHLQSVNMPGEFGPLCIRKTFLCTRCGRSTELALNKEEAGLAVVSWEGELQSDTCIDTLARSKGWLFGPVELRGEAFCYMLCPTCIQADLVCFQRLERFFLNEK